MGFPSLLQAVIRASFEKEERQHLLLTLARILALPDDAPRSEGNPLSNRFHWRGPMHGAMRAWLQTGESPLDCPFQMFRQPPHRQRLNMTLFNRAMVPHLPDMVSSQALAPTPGKNRRTSVVTETDVESDAQSVDTTAAIICVPPHKRKEVQPKVIPLEPVALRPSSSNQD